MLSSPFAKALAPLVLALAVAVVQGLVTGEWDSDALKTAGAGIVTAVVVYLVPNAKAGGSA